MAVLFKIDGKSWRCEGEIIAIGRAPSNQIALPDDARLAPVQAVLRLVSGRWIVESREGGPIRVGTGRPTQFAWLSPDDVIHLTESGPEVTFVPEASGGAAALVATYTPPAAISSAVPERPAGVAPMAVVPNVMAQPPVVPQAIHTPSSNIPPATAPTTPAAVPQWLVVAGLGGLAAAVLIAVGVFLGGDRSPAPIPVVASASPVEKSVPAQIESKVAVASATPAVVAPDTKVAAADPRNGLYRLELRTADRRKAMQLGTAWAVAPRRLVTTGDAARGIAANQQSYPLAVVRHSLTGQEFDISGIILHPLYAIANSKVERAAAEIERLLPELESTLKPDERQQIVDLLHKHDREAIDALDESVNVNLATLEVTKDLPSLLSWAPAPLPKIGQQLTLMGHPFSAVDMLVDPDHPTPLQQHIGRLHHAEPVHDPIAPSRYLVKFSDPLAGQNWSGSPVLNSAGTVIGLYARATRPLPGEPPAPIATHDIAVIDGVRDWLPTAINAVAEK